MKCDVIRDLIPLYAENLCSEESTALVKEHLSTCSVCNEYLTAITKDITPSLPSEKELEERLSEKDLLVKSKESIRKDTIKKILIVLNIIVITITSVIIAVYIFLSIDEIARFPALHYTFGINIIYLFGFILMLSPIIIGSLEIYSLVNRFKSKHYIRKFISNILLQLIAMILSLAMMFIMIVAPPFESRTNNLRNYLKTDKDIKKHETVYSSFFPEEISESANNPEYRYEKYSTLLFTYCKMQLSLTLPDNEYLTEKNRILAYETIPLEGEENAFAVVLSGVRTGLKPKLEFRFDDRSKKLSYNLYMEFH